jgi:hypothetical protein
MNSIEPRATLRRIGKLVVRWGLLSVGVCVVWFVVAFLATAIDYLTQMPPKAFSIVDQFPPPGVSGGLLAVVLVTMFQFGLINQRAASNIDATDLAAERIGAWIVGGGLFVLSWLLLTILHMASDISPFPAWALRSASSIAIITAALIFYYTIVSMTAERRRRSNHGDS